MLASIVWAATGWVPPDIFRYFLAQMLNSIVIHPAMWILGTKSPYYAPIYCVLTGVIFLAMMGIVRKRMNYWLPSAMAGLLTSFIIGSAMNGQIRYFNIIAIIDGAVMVTCGILVLFNAKELLHLTLGIFWLAMAGWRLCYTYRIPSWHSLNQWLPSAMCVTAFTIVGFLARRPLRVKDRLA